MLTLGIERIGDMAVVECKGRIVQSDATLKLHEAVTTQKNVRIVVLDLTQVRALEGWRSGNAVVSAALGGRPLHSFQAI